MKTIVSALLLLLLIFVTVFAQDDDSWPSLGYLRNDYKAVSVVAHIRIQQAEITGRVGGYENWKVSVVVLESFKGKVKKGDAITYFQGAEAGLKREYFDGEKLVFLLAETDPKTREVRYSVLENSTLASTPDRLSKLRLIRKQFVQKSRRKKNSLSRSTSISLKLQRHNSSAGKLQVRKGGLPPLKIQPHSALSGSERAGVNHPSPPAI